MLSVLSIFQPIGVVICSAIAFGFIPKYSCSPNFSEASPLPSCDKASSETPCCSKSQNMGWRYLLYTLGAITLFIFFLRYVVFTFRETPKFLVYKGQDEKAIKTLRHMAKINGTQCHLTMDAFEVLQSEYGSTDSFSSSRSTLGESKDAISTWTEKAAKELDRYRMLFDGFQMTRLTILTWLTYIMDFWGFTVAGKFVKS